MASSNIANNTIQQKYDDILDSLNFGGRLITSLSTHETEMIGIKSSSSSSSSTSSTSSATSSSSSQNSLNGNKLNVKQNIKTESYKPYKQSMLTTKLEPKANCTDKSDLMCQLCKNKLNEPKLLNCLHVFCKQCLVAHLMSECGDSQPSTLNCPKCKQETMIYEGIDNLQDDYIMHNMLDMTAIEEMILDCTSCNTTEKAEARCADCAQYLCEACIKAHVFMRCFEGHRVVKFDEIRNSYKQNLSKTDDKDSNEGTQSNLDLIDHGVPIHKPLFCKMHVKENLKFFCNTCQVPICADCIVSYHTQHSYERLADAESKNVEELNLLVLKAKEKIKECNGELTQTLDQYLLNLQEQYVQSKGFIEETNKSYKEVIEKRKEDLLKELEEKQTNKELVIMDLHNNIEQSIAQLNDVIKFVKRCLVNGNCSEILLLKNLIVNRLRFLIDNLPMVYNVDVNLKFHTERNRFEKAIFDTFGKLLTEKELKQRLLNQLTNEPSMNSNDVQQQQQRMQQIQQLQKQYDIQQLNQQQEWLMTNMINATKLQSNQTQLSRGANLNTEENFKELRAQQISQQNKRPPSRNSLALPAASHTDDWIRNILKLPNIQNQFDDNQTNQQILFNNQQNQLQTSLSPQSSTSSSYTNTHTSNSTGNSNMWLNNPNQQQANQSKLYGVNNGGNQLSLAQQQMLLNNLQQNNFLSLHKQQSGRANSPMDPNFQNANNLNQLQQGSNLASNFLGSNNLGADGSLAMNMASSMQSSNNPHFESNSIDEFMPFSSNGNNCSIAQNFTQLTKMVAPQFNQGLSELTMNQLTNAGFSDIHSSSSQSPAEQQLIPAIGAIGSSINTNLVNAENQSTFAGNGNLNPPVRQNGKMSNMHIRAKFGTLGSGKNQFNSPHGFCLSNEEDIIIADTNNHRIHFFDKNGEYKYSFGSQGKEDGRLYHPRKVAMIRDSGKIVVCDRGSERSRMQIFSKTGVFIKIIQIRYIDIVAGLVIAANGDIVAVDSVSPTVFRIVEKDGSLIKWFDCSAHMREPSDIAISNNDYYVCDFKGHCVVVFNYEGNLLRTIGGENITNFPNGIEISDAGDVLIGDSHGNRFHVAVFTREGSMLSEFECTSVKVSRCCGLKITSEGYVVTLAKNNHHALVLNTLYVA